MTTTAWFHCFSGVAGDMLLGALLDAGADVDQVRATVAGVGVEGWTLGHGTVQRAGLRASRAEVDAPADLGHHRTYRDIRGLLAGATLPERVRRRSITVFGALAEAEAGVHGVAVDDVHFHEVGALDAIVDVVGTCAALDLLDVDDVRTSPVRVGMGTVGGSHGELPNPAPAVVALLAQAGIAAEGVPTTLELATPTGVALLAGLVSGCGPLPPMTPHRIGYGAGHHDPPGRANVVQVVIGEVEPVDGAIVGPGQPMVELCANVDDATGEVLAHAVGALLAGGANDAWITPIVMKKGRPGHTLHALTDPAQAAAVAAILIAESGSLGLRATKVTRWPQRRDEVAVEVDGQVVRVKLAGLRAKAEYDDAARAAVALGLPLRDVLLAAERLACDRFVETTNPGRSS
jgi:uncharacterized protein (TIGR00299 family) protein